MDTLLNNVEVRVLGALIEKELTTPEYYPLVTDKVFFVGDLVAMVVAESRQQAEDACELIEVDYDPLPPVISYEAALDPAVARFHGEPVTGKIEDDIERAARIGHRRR